MKLYAPKYYKNFTCIADQCEHSCCIGWEIDIDGKTLKKYESLKSGYGNAISAAPSGAAVFYPLHLPITLNCVILMIL